MCGKPHISTIWGLVLFLVQPFLEKTNKERACTLRTILGKKGVKNYCLPARKYRKRSYEHEECAWCNHYFHKLSVFIQNHRILRPFAHNDKLLRVLVRSELTDYLQDIERKKFENTWFWQKLFAISKAKQQPWISNHSWD